MKKTLLSLALAASTLAANAADTYDITPKGTLEYCDMSAYVSTWLGVYYVSGMAVQMSVDGNDIYSNFFPNIDTNLFFKGTIGADGTTVTFSKDQKVATLYGYDLHLVEYIFDSEEAEEPSSYADVVMKYEDGRLYIEDDIEAPTRYIVLEGYQDGEDMGYLGLELCIDIKKLSEQPSCVEVPATATEKSYTYSYEDDYGNLNAVLGKVWVDGNDVYFDHYAGQAAVVKGTLNGNKVTIAKDQFLGADFYFLYSGSVTTEWEYDDEGNLLATANDSYSLDYDAETGVYSNADITTYQSALLPDGSIYSGTANLSIEPYAGDKAAVPSDPYNVELYDYSEEYGQIGLFGAASNFDEYGKFINPDKLEIAIIEDGEALTLSPDDGYSLSEDITWMPYGFVDENGGYDIMYSKGSVSFYLYETLFEKIGLQTRYTVDGVTKYSNIVYASLDGENTTVEVDHATGEPLDNAISTVKSESTKQIYNLYGQKCQRAVRGLNIVNGKKVSIF